VPPTAADNATVISMVAGTQTNVNNPGCVANLIQVSHGWGFAGYLNINAGGDLTCNQMNLSWLNDEAWVNVDGGTLNVGGGGMYLAGPATKTATLTINSGTTDIDGPLLMNVWGTTNGYINITGGTLDITTPGASTNLDPGGAISVSGSGQLITNQGIALGAGGVGLVDILGGGQWLIEGDFVATVGTWGNAVTGEGGTVPVLVDYNILNPGYTTLYVPEPMTMLTLGLGGLLFVRKRRV